VRELTDAERVHRFMRAVGAEATGETRAYLTGGTTAVLVGWRATTVDIDIVFEPERDEILRALPRIKDDLQVNVELASPAQFVPVPEGWEERSVFVTREGQVDFFHFDPYAQAISKLERAHETDLADVTAMIDRGLVEPDRLRALYEHVEPELYRFPAIDPRGLRSRVERVTGPHQ
jgi:hypothetical protein